MLARWPLTGRRIPRTGRARYAEHAHPRATENAVGVGGYLSLTPAPDAEQALTAKGFPTTDARTFVFARGGGGAARGGATLADAALVQQLSAQVAQAVRSRHGLAPISAAAPASAAVPVSAAVIASAAVPAASASSSDEGANGRSADRGATGGRKRSAGQVSASAPPTAPTVECTRAAPAAASSHKKRKKKQRPSASTGVRAGGVGVRRGACVGSVD